LPDLCNVQAVFSLILVGELLSVAFAMINRGIMGFEWLYFGMLSFLVQWIILASAACLCPLRSWFKRQNGIVAGLVSYGIVLVLTFVFTLMGEWLSTGLTALDLMPVFESLIIAAIFAGMILRFIYLQQQLQNREQAELRSRIQALQSRIRPHFLFNSMNSIASLIDIDPVAAEKMVVDLSQLFRASLKEVDLVPLDEEIALCQRFASIEQVRLGERLTMDWKVAVGENPPLVPSLLIQPLIENAIYHGIQSLPDGGVVTAAVVVSEGKVTISISNPVGNNTEPVVKSGNGIALENIQHRLQAHYGDGAVMQRTTSKDAFTINIVYPVTV